ncbi:MAG: hypothetical protein ABR907_11220 [Terracidiphilus sp.]
MSMLRAVLRFAKPADFFAFVICVVVGYFLGSMLPEGPWAAYTSNLVFYHLFLAWLVVDSGRDHGFTMPIVSTILTHAACLAIVIAYVAARDAIPLFVLLRFLTAPLALFERNWLFSDSKERVREAKVMVAPVSEEAATTIAEASAEDYDAWMQHLAQRNALTRKPGMTIQDEYEQWMMARAKSRAKSV